MLCVKKGRLKTKQVFRRPFKYGQITRVWDKSTYSLGFYSGLNLNQDKATKLQTVQIVRLGEATLYWFKVNPLYLETSNTISIGVVPSVYLMNLMSLMDSRLRRHCDFIFTFSHIFCTTWV